VRNGLTTDSAIGRESFCCNEGVDSVTELRAAVNVEATSIGEMKVLIFVLEVAYLRTRLRLDTSISEVRKLTSHASVFLRMPM